MWVLVRTLCWTIFYLSPLGFGLCIAFVLGLLSGWLRFGISDDSAARISVLAAGAALVLIWWLDARSIRFASHKRRLASWLRTLIERG